MDENDVLITRWDSAPHHPELETFPNHRHTEEGVEPCGEMTLPETLRAVERIVTERLE